MSLFRAGRMLSHEMRRFFGSDPLDLTGRQSRFLPGGSAEYSDHHRDVCAGAWGAHADPGLHRLSDGNARIACGYGRQQRRDHGPLSECENRTGAVSHGRYRCGPAEALCGTGSDDVYLGAQYGRVPETCGRIAAQWAIREAGDSAGFRCGSIPNPCSSSIGEGIHMHQRYFHSLYILSLRSLRIPRFAASSG